MRQYQHIVEGKVVDLPLGKVVCVEKSKITIWKESMVTKSIQKRKDGAMGTSYFP